MEETRETALPCKAVLRSSERTLCARFHASRCLLCRCPPRPRGVQESSKISGPSKKTAFLRSERSERRENAKDGAERVCGESTFSSQIQFFGGMGGGGVNIFVLTSVQRSWSFWRAPGSCALPLPVELFETSKNACMGGGGTKKISQNHGPHASFPVDQETF